MAVKGACDTSANANCSLARGSIFAFENALQLPEVGGEVYRPDLTLPQVSMGIVLPIVWIYISVEYICVCACLQDVMLLGKRQYCLN